MILWLTAFALAAELRLDDVLAVLDPRLPVWVEAVSEAEIAEAKALASRGAFDPKLAAKAGSYRDPGYDRLSTDVYLGITSEWGPSASVGHRLGRGDFPSYDGHATGDSGEAYVRVDVPLLDGLWFSEARVDRDVALAMAASKEASRDAKGVSFRFKAVSAYWKWVAAGQALRVEEQQLALAEERVRMLAREVEEGSRAPLDLLDNERALLERQEAVIHARQKLGVAAVELSLWWRDADGRPQVPALDQLPVTWPELPAEHPLEDDLDRAQRRPDLVALEAQLPAAVRLRQGAANALLPDVSLGAEVAHDVVELEQEVWAGLMVGSSLALRKERGSARAADAELRRLKAAVAGQADIVRADVLAAHAVRDTARQRLEATRKAAERAAEVVELERRRFELGGGDLFQLLLREGNLAKANKSVVDAELDLRLAEAAVDAAVGRGLDLQPSE